MSDEYHVKGSTLRSKLEFAGDRLGNGARDALAAYLEDEGYPVILDASWYPFHLYDSLLRKMAADYLGGDLTRLQEVGVYSAEKALTTTYQPYAARRDFALFLKRISALHDRFYDAGRLVVTATGDDHCELELRGAPEVSLADVQVAAGFYTGAARLLGLGKARVAFDLRDDRVRYRISW